MNQIEVHKQIDQIMDTYIGAIDSNFVRSLLVTNSDAKHYFFFRVDRTWLSWLRKNKFFDVLKSKSKDATKYSYQLPELEYLTRVSESDPSMVAKIIKDTPISSSTFNPEVVDRFLRIIGLLPAEEIKAILPKVLKEGWIKLMAPFNRSGYEYQGLVSRLYEARDFSALNKISEILLTPRTKEELALLESFSLSEKLFYLSDLTESGIFRVLVDSDNNEKNESLKIVSRALGQIVQSGPNSDDKPFAYSEPFYLRDIDLFDLEINDGHQSPRKDDIENLLAINKKLIDSLFIEHSSSTEKLRSLYKKYVSTLPDTYTTYRLKLFALTRYPTSFEKEIKAALFRVFDVGERYFDIDGGAEYHKALIISFGSLDEKIRRDYIAKVFEYYGALLDDSHKQEWRKRDGLENLFYVKSYLNSDELIKAEATFGKFPEDGKLAPHPSMGKITSGTVIPRSPVNLADFSIKQITDNLRTSWSPDALKEVFKEDSFLNPRGAEGLGDALKADFKERPNEYLTNLTAFFDREHIDPSYLYSILSEIDQVLRNKGLYTDEQYGLMFGLFDSIRCSGEATTFERSDSRRFLADWVTVHRVIADIILNILATINDSTVFKGNRNRILANIKYLLSIANSPNADDEKPEYGEPFHVAINSVRGEAYRALVQFLYSDGGALADDVKEIFATVLGSDHSNAIRFLIGHYLASFYFRDTAFIKGLLEEIFPKSDPQRKKEYFATWEGYLASSLYQDMYKVLGDYYSHAIIVNQSEYPDREYFKGLDESLAIHLALAYAHFDLTIDSVLFKQFWETPSEPRHSEFISFLGQHCINRAQAGEAWLQNNKVSREKLIDFWTWVLGAEVAIEPKSFAYFGFWVNPKVEVISDQVVVEKISASLQKSQGEIDWEYGVMERIGKFAEINPKETLEIIKSLLLLNDNLSPHHRMYFNAASQIKGPLETIYKDPALKASVNDLVSTLIEKGGAMFWDLKQILI